MFRGKNVCFSEILACFAFLKHPFWDSPFYLITDELSLCILSLFLLPMYSYLFPMFVTGSGTSSAISRNIFIFNWTIDVKLCNFRLRAWVNVKALARFHPKLYDENIICVSSTKWYFRLPWNCQACKREIP